MPTTYVKKKPGEAEELEGEVEPMEDDNEKDGSSDDDDDDNESSSSSSSSVDSEQLRRESIALTRQKRGNAGSKMAQMEEEAVDEDELFGSLDDKNDGDFESPVTSEDDFDSDFYNPEEEDEPISDVEESVRQKRKTEYKEPKLGGGMSKKALLEKNKKWVMARMGCFTTAANTVSPETQAQYLEEAKETERRNIASLRKYEQFELEKKKKREKANVIRKLKPPYVSTVDGPNGKYVIVPDVKKFEMPKRPVKLLCCVTSRPAKYRDPLTGLPYATPEAFKIIREKYAEYLKSMPNHPAVKAWLAQQS